MIEISQPQADAVAAVCRDDDNAETQWSSCDEFDKDSPDYYYCCQIFDKHSPPDQTLNVVDGAAAWGLKRT
jgi:hypothetical protein